MDVARAIRTAAPLLAFFRTLPLCLTGGVRGGDVAVCCRRWATFNTPSLLAIMPSSCRALRRALQHNTSAVSVLRAARGAAPWDCFCGCHNRMTPAVRAVLRVSIRVCCAVLVSRTAGLLDGFALSCALADWRLAAHLAQRFSAGRASGAMQVLLRLRYAGSTTIGFFAFALRCACRALHCAPRAGSARRTAGFRFLPLHIASRTRCRAASCCACWRRRGLLPHAARAGYAPPSSRRCFFFFVSGSAAAFMRHFSAASRVLLAQQHHQRYRARGLRIASVARWLQHSRARTSSLSCRRIALYEPSLDWFAPAGSFIAFRVLIGRLVLSPGSGGHGRRLDAGIRLARRQNWPRHSADRDVVRVLIRDIVCGGWDVPHTSIAALCLVYCAARACRRHAGSRAACAP